MSLLQSIDYHAIAPVLILAATALGSLFAGRRTAAPLAVIGTVAALATTVSLVGSGQRATFCLAPGQLPSVVGGAAVGRSCSYVVDSRTLFFQLIVLGTLVVVLLLGRESSPTAEWHLLLLSSAAGMLTIAAARDLLTLVVSLEVLSLPVYVLAGMRRGDSRSAEAALKFFLVSVISSAVTLLGIALVYGLTGTLQLDRIASQLTRPDLHTPATSAAVVLTLVGFVFKVSAVPFHAWAPDTYQGAPLPIATWLAVASKTAGFAGLISLLVDGFFPYAGTWAPVMAILATATMTFGNLVALQQRNVVRLLAWSSIAQAGYILVPLAVTRVPAEAVSATLAYIAIYAVMNVGAFACVAAAARAAPRGELADYRGLARRAPFVAVTLTFFLLCLAGVPPGLAGLFAKVVVFRAAIDGGLGWLAVVMALNTVVGLAVYLRVAVVLFTDAAPEPATQTGRLPTSGAQSRRVRPGVALAITIPAFGASVIGIYPTLVLHAATLAGR